MWLYTKYGFFSVVCAREGDGAHGNPVDPRRVMVRARRREHLEHLLSEVPGVHQSVGTDYRYRVFLPKDAWAAIARALAEDIDYDNFKDAAHAHLDWTPHGQCYTESLADVWEMTARIQDD